MEEIISGEELKGRLMYGIRALGETVTTTMGPYGKTVIITDDFGRPYVTKDGVSVANAITFKDPVSNHGASILKQVAQKTVEEAGDGTTTSICLALAFIDRGYQLMEDGWDYNELRSKLETLLEVTSKHLKKNSRKLRRSNIIDVATISANNDKVLGEVIQRAYNHSKIVKVDETEQIEDSLTLVDGMQLRTGYFNKAFINKGDRQTIEYTDIDVILIDGKLESFDDIAIMLNKTDKVLIVADHFSEKVTSILKTNYNKNALDIALVKSPGVNLHRVDLMNDLSLYTGTKLVKKGQGATGLGHVDSIEVHKDKTIITQNSIKDEVKEKLEELEAASLLETQSHAKELLKQRISNLTGSISIIKVGGKSDVEIKEKKDRYDDAVLAVLCAIEEGIIEGAGSTFATAVGLPQLKDNPFTDCLRVPLAKIHQNSDGKLNLLKETNLFKLGIVDPLKVSRSALENAISVSKTILSTEAVVLNERLWGNR